jgi:hypothetical protein
MQSDNHGAIRVSYSILNSWAHGDIDRAVAPFAGVEVEPTQPMIDGKTWHAKWERETKRTGRLPKCFGGRKLESPDIELATKKVRKLTDWCVLSGVLDVRDGKTGIDYKTGKSSATDYANSMQHKCYQVLYPELNRFEYHCRNQHLHKSDDDHKTMSIVHLTRQSLEEGLEWVLTMAAELREYLINNGYGDKLDQGKGLE